VSGRVYGQNLTSGGSHKSYRPLTVLSFRLNVAVGGLEPASSLEPPPPPPLEDAGAGTSAGAGAGERGTIGAGLREDGGGGGGGGATQPRPFGFHLVNVILHCVVTVLVHRLALRLAALAAPDRPPPDRPPAGRSAAPAASVRRQAWVAAALFAVHPVGRCS
jgi:hypothetical protein